MTKELILSETRKRMEFDAVEDTKIAFVCIGTSELEITVNINSKGVRVEMIGVVYGTKENSFKIKTTCNHVVGQTKSHTLIRGVFYDDSSLLYDGMIRISEGADLSDAYLANDNLVFGKHASVNTSPQLEILADDVKASHGVTIKGLDPNSQFYLESRGLSTSSAKRLLTYGFLKGITNKFSDESRIMNLLKLNK